MSQRSDLYDNNTELAHGKRPCSPTIGVAKRFSTRLANRAKAGNTGTCSLAHKESGFCYPRPSQIAADSRRSHVNNFPEIGAPWDVGRNFTGHAKPGASRITPMISGATLGVSGTTSRPSGTALGSSRIAPGVLSAAGETTPLFSEKRHYSSSRQKEFSGKPQQSGGSGKLINSVGIYTKPSKFPASVATRSQRSSRGVYATSSNAPESAAAGELSSSGAREVQQCIEVMDAFLESGEDSCTFSQFQTDKNVNKPTARKETNYVITVAQYRDSVCTKSTRCDLTKPGSSSVSIEKPRVSEGTACSSLNFPEFDDILLGKGRMKPLNLPFARPRMVGSKRVGFRRSDRFYSIGTTSNVPTSEDRITDSSSILVGSSAISTKALSSDAVTIADCVTKCDSDTHSKKTFVAISTTDINSDRLDLKSNVFPSGVDTIFSPINSSPPVDNISPEIASVNYSSEYTTGYRLQTMEGCGSAGVNDTSGVVECDQCKHVNDNAGGDSYTRTCASSTDCEHVVLDVVSRGCDTVSSISPSCNATVKPPEQHPVSTTTSCSKSIDEYKQVLDRRIGSDSSKAPLSKPCFSSVFQTASGDSVSISAESIALSKALLAQVDNANTTQCRENWPTTEPCSQSRLPSLPLHVHDSSPYVQDLFPLVHDSSPRAHDDSSCVGNSYSCANDSSSEDMSFGDDSTKHVVCTESNHSDPQNAACVSGDVSKTSFVGFSTASGGKVEVSKRSLDLVRSRLGDGDSSLCLVPSNDDRSMKQSLGTKDTHEAGNDVTVFDNPNRSSILDCRVVKSTALETNSTKDFCEPLDVNHSDDSKCSTSRIFVNPESSMNKEKTATMFSGGGGGGFQTANGRKMIVSDDALRRAKLLFDDIDSAEDQVVQSTPPGQPAIPKSSSNSSFVPPSILKSSNKQVKNDTTHQDEKCYVITSGVAAKSSIVTDTPTITPGRPTGVVKFGVQEGTPLTSVCADTAAGASRKCPRRRLHHSSDVSSNLSPKARQVLPTDMLNLTQMLDDKCDFTQVRTSKLSNVGTDVFHYNTPPNPGYNASAKTQCQVSFKENVSKTSSQHQLISKEVSSSPVNQDKVSGKECSSPANQDRVSGMEAISSPIIGSAPTSRRRISRLSFRTPYRSGAERVTSRFRQREETKAADGEGNGESAVGRSTGELMLLRSGTRDRITLKQITPVLHPFSPQQLEAYGVTAAIRRVTFTSALQFRFKHDTPVEVDGFTVVPDNSHSIGLEQVELAVRKCHQLCSDMIPRGWLANAYRHIVWKLACYERRFPHVAVGKCLCVRQLMRQLRLRYDVELFGARRPALRKITEADDTACKTLVLCVTQIFPTSSDRCNLQLSDGWYSIPAFCDLGLRAQLETDRVSVGTKLVIHGAEITGQQQPCSPLELPAGAALSFSTNSCRRASWHVRLGYWRDPRPFRVSLRSVLATGGLVPRLDLLVTRVYPILYCDKSSGTTVFLTQRMERRLSLQREAKRSRDIEQMSATLERDFAEISDREFSSTSCFSRQQVSLLSNGQDVYEYLVSSADQAAAESLLTDNQKLMALEYKRHVLCEQRRRIESSLREKTQQLAGNYTAPVPCLKVRVTDEKSAPESGAMLTLWRPPDDIYSILEEGSSVSVVSAVASGKRHGCLQLTLGRQARLNAREPLPGVQLPCRVLVGESVAPPYGEVDIVAVVVHVQPATDTATLQRVYLCDHQRHLVSVSFSNGLKNVCLDSVVVTGRVLTLLNLRCSCGGNFGAHLFNCHMSEFSDVREHTPDRLLSHRQLLDKAMLKDPDFVQSAFSQLQMTLGGSCSSVDSASPRPIQVARLYSIGTPTARGGHPGTITPTGRRTGQNLSLSRQYSVATPLPPLKVPMAGSVRRQFRPPGAHAVISPEGMAADIARRAANPPRPRPPTSPPIELDSQT